ncbi:MAG: PH domain-containing protein [Anaerolineaceae bacterium]
MSTNVPGGNPLQKFLNEEQDPAIVPIVFQRVSQILTSGEEIIYIAIQKKPVANLSPDAAVLTNKRFIIYRPKLLGGANFEDYIWRDLSNVKLEENLLGATISFHTTRGTMMTLDYLPKVQARKLYSFAQEKEEKVLEERRNRKMEEARAAAGGVFIQGQTPINSMPSSTSPVKSEDPLETLKNLKKMLEADLITKEEYDSKKAEILSKM